MELRLIGLMMALLLTGCKESDSAYVTDVSQASPPSASPSETLIIPIDSSSASESHNDITPAEAKAFATKLLQKITVDEQFIKDAFELKEYDTLKKYALHDVPEYMNKPYSKVETQVPFISPYFPYSKVMDPYTSCDSALNKLAHLASIMGNVVRDDTAGMRQILRQEKEKYIAARDKCKKRVHMSYEEALKAYNAE